MLGLGIRLAAGGDRCGWWEWEQDVERITLRELCQGREAAKRTLYTNYRLFYSIVRPANTVAG